LLISRKKSPMDEMEKMNRGYKPITKRRKAPLKPGMTKVAPFRIQPRAK